MDYTILYILGFIFIAIFLIIGITYLKKNNKIDDNTLSTVASVLGLSVSVISELNLNNEEKILVIGNIVVDSVNYARDILKVDNNEDLANIAIAYACKLCEDQGIELNDSRVIIIENLVKLSVVNVSNVSNLTN